MHMKSGILKKMVLCLTAGIFVIGAAGCGGTQDQTQETAQEASSEETASSTSSTSDAETKDAGMHHVEITIKDYGTIALELDADTAPVTVENFINLAEEGFYDGLTFHRIIEGFMIQGGDPAQSGDSKTAASIPGEFASNGYENDISHKAGVISMARTQDPNSASSQFFITVADSEFLDGEYAAFGHVTEGLDVAQKIAEDAEPIDENGTIPFKAQPVIEKVVVLD